jgi:hypothetical protein
MAHVPANTWLIAFGLLAGAALLASLLLALLFVFVARRFFQLPAQRALAFSFAAQAALILAVWLAVEDPRDGLRFYIFILAPVALTHLLIAPFLRRKT